MNNNEHMIKNSVPKNIQKTIAIILVIISCILISSAFVYTIFFSPKNNKKIKDDKMVLKGDMTLESIYRREVVENLEDYLNYNKEVLNSKDKVVIATKNIVPKDEQFEKCSGKVTVTRDNENYLYLTDVTCDKKTTGRNVEYKLYAGNLSDIYEVSNGIVIASKVDMQNDSYNALLTMFDNTGNKKWSTKYDEPNKENITNKIEIHSVNNYKNNYLVNVKITSSEVKYKTLVIDSEGKIVNTIELNDSEYELTEMYEFVNEDNNKLYFQGIAKTKTENEIPVIIAISDSKIELVRFEYEKYEEQSTTIRNILHTKNNYFYGNSTIIDKEKNIKNNVVFKMDSTGKIILEKEISKISPTSYIKDIYVISSNEIYIHYMSVGTQLENKEEGIYKLNKNLEVIDSIEYKQILNDQNVTINSLTTKDNNLEICFRNNENAKAYLMSIDKKNKIVEISLENVNDKFTQKYLYKDIIAENKVIQVYTNSSDLSLEDIILVFYK